MNDTHTHTPTKRTKVSTNMHSKQALSPIHDICRLLWILKAKKLFVRTLGAPFVQTILKRNHVRYSLPNLCVCDSRHSPTSALLLSLFHGNGIKAFKTAAIEDDAETKAASDSALSDRILRKWLARRWSGHLCRV